MSAGQIVVREGDPLSIDGESGEVFLGEFERETMAMTQNSALEQFLSWSDVARTLGLYAHDAPLHEFLPDHEQLLIEAATLRATGADPSRLAIVERQLKETVDLQESNPMLGHRGCRLGISYPAVYEMQVRAVLRAACDLVD